MLDALLPRPRQMGFSTDEPPAPRDADTRQRFRKMLREGTLDDREIEIEVQAMPNGVEIMAPPGMEEMQQQLSQMFSNLGVPASGRAAFRYARRARSCSTRKPASSSMKMRSRSARWHNAEQNGIVFIDEIDKIARRQDTIGADVSREGVQRDLLPLVEGCTVATKYGPIKTDHVLF